MVIVQVVIGLSFLFFLLSIVASALNEAIAGIFKLRARTLEKGIENLITGTTSASAKSLEIVEQLYSHPLINSYGRNTDKPSYLSSRAFRAALLDVTHVLDAVADAQIAGADSGSPDLRKKIAGALDQVPDEQLQELLKTIWRSVGQNVEKFQAGVERWFDRGMERVSGWYKRRVQLILFIVGLALAVTLNASAITAADRLWKDEGFRRGLIAQLENRQAQTTPQEALDRLETLSFPVGWEESNRPDGIGSWLLAVLGWLLTGIAITFGAPFWFDLLSKVSNLRAAGAKPPETAIPRDAPEGVPAQSTSG